MKLLVVGSLNVDLVIKTDVLPKMGETVYGSGFSTVCGGKGANQAVAAAKLGAEVKMIGAVGNDVFGKKLIENLNENGILNDGINECEGSSGIAVITVFNGDNSIILEKGANAKLTSEMIDKNIDLIKWADIIVFQFEIPMETVLYTAKLGKQLNKTVVVNTAPICDVPDELYAYTDIIILNEHEASALLGYEVTADVKEKAIGYFRDKGCGQVIITLGEKGCIYNDLSETKKFGIYKVKTVDTTGAGDSFIAGFCVARESGMSVKDSIAFASKTAAIAASRMGASSSIPNKKEVEETELEYDDATDE